ncbi:MAG TPA: hypothetical protein VHX19_23180 [Stellaceae bacterium]|nr:hypothetical protein [Stellaceae bacterium]
MIALTTAFSTAALALIGNIVFGLWNRFSERRSIAAALAGEIGAYVTLLDPETSSANYRKLAAFEYALRKQRLRSLPKTPVGHPVFDKVADKIGLLPTTESLDVSSIYNVVSGFRIIISNLSSDQIADAEDVVQSAMIIRVAETIEKYSPSARDLVDRLKRISNENFWQFLKREFLGNQR